MIKRLFQVLILLIFTSKVSAQQQGDNAFRAYLYNNEYAVYLRINLYDQDIQVPGQELYGKLPGYLGKHGSSFCWLITSADINSDKEATLQLINDFGSEDLEATLVRQDDSTYVLRHEHGSTIKVPNKGKWQRLPKTLKLKRK